MQPLFNLAQLDYVSQLVYQGVSMTLEELYAFISANAVPVETGLTVTEETGLIAGQYVEVGTEVAVGGELAGGVTYGTQALEVIDLAEGEYTIASAGAVTGVSVGGLVAGVLTGLGIGLVSYEVAPEFWTGISNVLFGTELDPITLSKYFIPAIYKDGKNYIPESVVNRIYDYINESGYYQTQTKYEEELDPSTITGNTVELTETLGLNLSAVTHLAQMYYTLKYKEIIQPFRADASFFNFVYNALISEFRNEYGFDPNGIICNAGANYLGNRVYYNFKLVFAPLNAPLIFDNYNDYIAINDSRVRFSRGVQVAIDYTTGEYVGYLYGGSTGNIIDFNKDVNNPYSGTANTYMKNVIEPKAGIEPIKNANEYDPSKSLEQNFPAWVGGRKSVGTIQGTETNPKVVPETYVPVAVPEIDPLQYPEEYPTQNPYKYPDTQPQPQPQPDPQPDTWSDKPVVPIPNPQPKPTIKPYYEPVKDPVNKPVPEPIKPPSNPSEPVSPSTPVVVPPLIGGSANKLFTVYNPSQSNLDNLGGFLWNVDIIKELIVMFTNNPLDAIISLHQIYCTPVTGSAKNIKLGYLDTGIASPEVTNQYAYIDCGTVAVAEFFGDVLDYEPYTKISIYLPFIGIKDLDTNYVMASMVNVKYSIDVFTGACLCTINITKKGSTIAVYHFEGNCSVQLPLTGADRTRLLSGILTGFGGGLAGGVAGGVAGAVVGGLTHMKSTIQKSGSIGSNVGAMDIKKPYLIINREEPYLPSEYNVYYGYPSNKTVTLSSCAGYTRVKEVHVDNIASATSIEKINIETLLKNGIIIQ